MREAKLLRARPGLLIELDGRIELSPPGRIALPGLDDGVVLRSTYALDIDADRAGPVDYRLSYMAQGLGWTADYAVELDKAEQTASIQGRATVRAPAGRSYRNARVRLVAGSVNRHVHRGPRPQAKMAMRASAMAADAESIGSPVSVSELQVYELPRRQDLRAGAEEKVVLFNAARVPVQKPID